MTTTRTRSEIGRSNNRKGKDREQRLARFLHEHGWPTADRTGSNAYRTTTRTRPDTLDIHGTPGLVWSVKDDASQQIRRWLHEAEQVRAHVGADLAVLVVRRPGKASPGQWWAWVPVAALIQLTTGRLPRVEHQVPVCVELGDLVPMLHAAGYGTDEEE